MAQSSDLQVLRVLGNQELGSLATFDKFEKGENGGTQVPDSSPQPVRLEAPKPVNLKP